MPPEKAVREAIESLPEEVRENPETQEVIAKVDYAYLAARSAQNMRDLERQIILIRELALQILNLRSQYDEEAIYLLLLDS